MSSKTISQEAFDELVKENREVFDMEAEEALKSTIEELELQGIDLSGIIKSAHPQELAEHPVAVAIQRLKCICGQGPENSDSDNLLLAFKDLRHSVDMSEKDKRNEALAVAGKLESVSLILKAMHYMSKEADSFHTAISTLISLMGSGALRDTFFEEGGPKLMSVWIHEFDDFHSITLLARLGETAAKKHEGNKCRFMDSGFAFSLHKILQHDDILTADEVISAISRALASFTTADDPSAPTSRAMQNARVLSEKGVVSRMLEILGAKSEIGANERAVLVDCLSAVRCLAANDEICRSLVEAGGVQTLLKILEKHEGCRDLTRSWCVTLKQLTYSDVVKRELMGKNGASLIYRILSSYSEDSSTLEIVLGIMTNLTLRNPGIAEALASVGCVELLVEALKDHGNEPRFLRQAGMCTRNIVVRSPELKQRFLEQGIEPLLRTAKARFPNQCGEAMSAALRDLGFDDYH